MRGFTIAEILVVLALMTIIAGFALFVSLDPYRGNSLRAERSTLVSSLQHARAEAIDDVCTGAKCTQPGSHGVAIRSSAYIIFQGDSFASRDADEDIPITANTAIIHSGTAEIAFAASSGDALEYGTVTLTDPEGKVASITVAPNGRISWSD